MAPKLLILVHNLAENCLGRGYLLAELAQGAYEVRITGPLRGPAIWPPCPQGRIPIDAWCHRDPTRREISRQADQFDADIVLASKVNPATLGLARMARRRRGIPFLLDVDDWDVAAGHPPSAARWLTSALRPWKWRRLWTYWLERQVGRADAITVASSFLQQRYGGALLPHVRDVEVLDPSRIDGRDVRRKLQLEDQRLVVFLGTPRRHKGIEDAAVAVASLADTRFLVVGADPDNAYARELGERFRNVLFHPPCRLDEVPHFLAAADVVVIPQRDTHFSRAQLPAKLVDAMAMARPIVATDVGDIPRWLDGCGQVVPPGDVDAMARALRWTFEHPDEANAAARRARERAVRELSYDAGRPVLLEALESALGRV